jgi:hypothetical protein
MNINQNKIKLTSYISINGWMISNLPKVGVSTMNEVMIFAIIYSYSKDPDTMFTGALPYLIKQSLTSRTTCIKILTKLTELQLIFKKVDGQRNYYYVNQSKLHELQNEMPEVETSLNLNQSKLKPVQNPTQTGTESDTNQSNFRTGLVQNPTQTGTETTPNNIIYPINNKTDKIDIKKTPKINKKLTIDDCKTILSEYDGFSTEEKDSLSKWIDHKYLIRNEKYVNAGWRAILQECLNQSQSGRDICYVIHKSMTSGSDGIGWQGIRFDLIDFRKKVVTQPLIEQTVQQEVVSDELIAERKKILLAKIREGKEPKEISDDDWSISSCLQEAVENLIKDKLDE